jgi:hypothetical protein
MIKSKSNDSFNYFKKGGYAMTKQKITISADGPVLSGTVYKSNMKCGKANCRCALDSAERHVVYQWSGNIDGKNTSRALTIEMYLECKNRIANYKKFKRLFVAEVDRGLKAAPWIK